LVHEDSMWGQSIVLLCGRGNNGGDGYVIARLLAEQPYEVSILDFALGEASTDNLTNRKKCEELGIGIETVASVSDLPEFSEGALLIDAVFGTGLSRPVEGRWAEVFGKINRLPNQVWSIDIPSGVFSAASSEQSTRSESSGTASVRAQITFSLGYPKPAEFVPEVAEFYGDIENVDFELADVSVLSDSPFAQLFTASAAKALFPKRGKHDHKGTFGHALLVAGSHGKIGAAVLSARGC